VELTFDELVKAYLDCRKRKRKTRAALDFEFNLESNLFDLYTDLRSCSYEIGMSIAFVVDQPRVREVWAASFRDRIVHHLIYNRLSPWYYKKFIRNSFACIPERGTLDASNRLTAGLRSQTENWSKQSYYMGADVRNFFVSIDKNILWALLKPNIKEEWLRNLTKQVLFHDPRESCFLKSKKKAFARVPGHKSLWNTNMHKGLPIGNLTSQFFANVYLDELDQFVKHELKVKKYYRYVDDLIILDADPQKLNTNYKKIEEFLETELALSLHPFKKRVGFAHQGVDFVGYVHKPFCRFMRKRTIEKAHSVSRQWKRSKKAYSRESLEKLRSRMNSYFGLFKWAKTYKERKKMSRRINCLFVYANDDCSKIMLNN
jgi:hypothetical protein